MRKRLYATNAERQQAYRARSRTPAELPPETVTSASEDRVARRPSRPKRLQQLEELADELSNEYQTWLNRTPANLSASELAQSLERVIEQLNEVAALVGAIEPPRVGR